MGITNDKVGFLPKDMLDYTEEINGKLAQVYFFTAIQRSQANSEGMMRVVVCAVHTSLMRVQNRKKKKKKKKKRKNNMKMFVAMIVVGMRRLILLHQSAIKTSTQLQVQQSTTVTFKSII
jgi:hypothetical protein